MKKFKVYDEITFDSSTVEKIHPRLFKVEVHHLSDIKSLNDDAQLDAVNIDGEFFLRQPQQT